MICNQGEEHQLQHYPSLKGSKLMTDIAKQGELLVKAEVIVSAIKDKQITLL